MPKAYLVGCYREVKDPEALAAYAKLGGTAGEFLPAVDGFKLLRME